jgi:hypothetical protein
MKPHIRIIIDAAALLVYLVVANPLITGLAVHEWAGLAILVVFVAHTAVNLDAVFQVLHRRASKVGIANLVLDIVLFITFMVVTVSGVMVSRYILPVFGFVAPGYFFWNPLHAIAAKVLLALLVVHVVAHFRWFLQFVRKGGRKAQDDGFDPDV